MERLQINVTSGNESVQLPETLGFGQLFTENCFTMDYIEGKGWVYPQINKLEKLSLHPATMMFHYGQAVFEGLKAFKNENGEVFLFRPDMHIKRLNNSSKRVVIPEVDEKFVIDSLKELLKIEKNWIPTGVGQSLYVRPFIISTDPYLGVRPSNTYKLLIILSPVGAYYSEGFKPVKILVQDDYVRAVRKGLGECKTPANYAASLLAGEEAKKIGYTQVLWLDAVELKYIEEVGTMNIFINFNDEVATPSLDGSILPGVTRNSVIAILKEWGLKITERKISIDEIAERYKKGEVTGVFGTGTAAVISSVGLLKFKDMEMTFNNGQIGELDKKLYDEITGIQFGHKPDKFNWLQKVV